MFIEEEQVAPESADADTLSELPGEPIEATVDARQKLADILRGPESDEGADTEDLTEETPPAEEPSEEEEGKPSRVQRQDDGTFSYMGKNFGTPEGVEERLKEKDEHLRGWEGELTRKAQAVKKLAETAGISENEIAALLPDTSSQPAQPQLSPDQEHVYSVVQKDPDVIRATENALVKAGIIPAGDASLGATYTSSADPMVNSQLTAMQTQLQQIQQRDALMEFSHTHNLSQDELREVAEMQFNLNTRIAQTRGQVPLEIAHAVMTHSHINEVVSDIAKSEYERGIRDAQKKRNAKLVGGSESGTGGVKAPSGNGPLSRSDKVAMARKVVNPQ